MTTMNDDELTKLAIQELLKDAKRFKDKRDAEFRATQMKRPMQTNKPFLKNTLRDVLSFNKKKSEKHSQNVHKFTKRKLLNKGNSHKFTVSNKKQTKPKTNDNKDVNTNTSKSKKTSKVLVKSKQVENVNLV